MSSQLNTILASHGQSQQIMRRSMYASEAIKLAGQISEVLFLTKYQAEIDGAINNASGHAAWTRVVAHKLRENYKNQLGPRPSVLARLMYQELGIAETLEINRTLSTPESEFSEDVKQRYMELANTLVSIAMQM